MTATPWIRFFASDWLAGTRGMTAAETGVYITLIALMYEKGGSIENNPARLSRLCGASNSMFKKTLAVLIEEGKVVEEAGYLTNNRAVEELSYSINQSEVAREKANRRWRKNSNKNNDYDDAAALQQQCHGNTEIDANQNQNQITTEDKPSVVDPPAAKPAPKAKRGTRISDDWQLGPEERRVASEEGVQPESVERAFKKFKLHFQTAAGQRATKIDWMKTWRNWCVNDAERQSRFPPKPPDKPKFRNGFAEILYDMNAEQHGFFDDQPDRNAEPEIIPPDRSGPGSFRACGPDIFEAGGRSCEPVVVDFQRHRAYG